MYLEVEDSVFQRIQSLTSGAFIVASKSTVLIWNSLLKEIGGDFGGVFHSHFNSNLTFVDCDFESNFGISGAIGSIDNDGMFNIIGGTIQNSFAIHASGFDLQESPLVNLMQNVVIWNNIIIT